jgi:hypothetical protein
MEGEVGEEQTFLQESYLESTKDGLLGWGESLTCFAATFLY